MIRFGVQFFNKPDTTLATLESIRKCARVGKVHLTLLQDGLEGHHPKFLVYRDAHAETRRVVDDWVARNANAFASVEVIHENQGRGTAPTARILIDRLAHDSDWFVFSEDDVIFARDVLLWFRRVLSKPRIFADHVWAVAGESRYFDGREFIATPEHVAMARDIAIRNDLLNAYVLTSAYPSSCFASTPERWAQFRETRGENRGPRLVNDRARAEGRQIVWPVVGRCRDIGMHHPNGFSMTLKRDPAVIPDKNVFLTSDDLPATKSRLRLLDDPGARIQRSLRFMPG